MSDTQNFDNTQQPDGGGQVDTTQPQGETDRLLDNFMRETDGPQRRETPGVPGQTPTHPTQTPPGQTPQPPDQRRGQAPGQRQPTQQGGAQPGQPAQVPQVPQAARQYGNLFLADGNGDIYDAQGRLVAKQGYGRSIFHKLYPYIEAATTENAALRQRVEGFENANAVAKQNGLSIEDYGAALHLMVQWKKNPVETINTLLRVAQERGTDVSAIRGGGGLDPTAIRSIVEEVVRTGLQPFQPFVEQQQRDAEARQHEAAVVEQYNEFINDFPDVAPHQLSVANVMRDHGMSAREAYFALRAFAAQNGLDWSQDLRPQLMARAPGSPSGTGNDRGLPPMGGGRGNGVAPALPTRAGDSDENWSSIIRRTFKQHGVDIP